MKELIQTMMNHRTIRKFTDQPISEDLIETLLNVTNRAASSTGMQRFSILRIRDNNIREQLAAIGKQDYMKDATELFIFIVDCYRNVQIGLQKDVPLKDLITMDFFFQGYCDAMIAAQTMVNAAEALQLGTNYFGNIQNDAKATIELLKLPKYTFPVVGLGIGYPDQNPQQKPKIPLKHKVFTDTYHVSDNYLEALKEYDDEMKTYYDLRNANQRVDSFTDQVKTQALHAITKRSNVLAVIEQQGFLLDVKLE